MLSNNRMLGYYRVKGGYSLKLNHDCVRAVLLAIEELRPDQLLYTDNSQSSSILADFSNEDILYSVERLLEAGYIDAIDASSMDGSSYLVKNITWSGHQFLDNIRDDGIWKKTKATASKLTGVSLPILTELANSFIKQKLGLP